MRRALVLLTAVLLAATVPAPAGSATKYKPCTLLTTTDLEGALKAKLSRGQQEGGNVEDEPGPLKGETIDWCSWILGPPTVGVVLRVTRAVASISQMADYVFTPLEESAKGMGATVKRVKVADAECTVFGNVTGGPSPVKNSMLCLTAGKGRALSIEINSATPVPASVAQGLLAKAITRLP
ncbi:MAG TPA: hypothetical protein VFP86_06525 [bacterium]|nr:hypothetical protein [bacterium]